MRIITTAVITAIMIGGWASARDTMVYEKPRVSAWQKREDEAACTLAALDTSAQHGSAVLYVDRDTVNDCMRARGYKVLTGT
jgi:hypothetical protein